MPRDTKRKKPPQATGSKMHPTGGGDPVFHLDFLTPEQKLAWEQYRDKDVTFLIGPAGTGKTHLAVGFALNELFRKTKRKVVLTRPVVEAGENLGFLPGTLEEKIDPYMLPLFDAIEEMVGRGNLSEFVKSKIEIAPVAYMRGRTFKDCVVILDEAQNCTMTQMKMVLSRLGRDSKMIVTGDPMQSDLYGRGASPLTEVADRLSSIPEIGVVRFSTSGIVRHPLVGKMLTALGDGA